ncbi:ADP-glyceromanno-heptose 6-epimerase [Membranihabitans maritimus]|uniref:ADP-glyceromanno-heptose 6-epimerase n=1 Tax=Membranihabitans maritimus TaxID=2904244 RepID=UPI001F01EF9C|nr:ADP-glyceromanno-heptose 6-epimerase [Membranihabitans maritimus]
MIIVTGAAGFIASCMVQKLNEEGIHNIGIVDDFSVQNKEDNWKNKSYSVKIERSDFENWLVKNGEKVDAIIHLGARTDTTEFDRSIFERLNVAFSKMIWTFAESHNTPLLYASSAATYGGGEHGYSDNHDIVDSLVPLNPYGDSKNEFDQWALGQEKTPEHWYGLKFFNVYGPNEYHKGRMSSVILGAFNQIRKNGGMKLFRSHNPDYKDGEQLRDFIYVKDVVNMMWFLLNEKPESGLYNIGTGEARTFLDLTRATFNALGVEENISFIDTPEDIRDKYQYFTEAEMDKLLNAGYETPITSLEDGVEDYVRNYLKEGRIY